MQFSMIDSYILKNSIFRIGEIYSVDGRTVTILVDKDKNLSHLLYKGELIKNVSVGGYIKILKGFTRIIAKVESEYLKENKNIDKEYHHKSEEINRFLLVKLIGYFEGNKYYKGVKEVPLIGNVGLLMDNDEFSQIHRFAKLEDPTLKIGNLVADESVPIEIGIDKLFTSHIGIFGNTGSGKSYTLANLYKKLFNKVGKNKNFQQNAKFLLFDFNGEYAQKETITSNKKIYNLSTHSDNCDKIPLMQEDLLNPELMFILASATEKTQQPFIRRTFGLYNSIMFTSNHENATDSLDHFKNLVIKQLKHALLLKDAQKSKLIFDYAAQFLPTVIGDLGEELGIVSDLEPYSNGGFKKISTDKFVDNTNMSTMFESLLMRKSIDTYVFPSDFLSLFIHFLYLRLIIDVLASHVNNEHIAPAINKLKSFRKDFDKVFAVTDEQNFWADCNLAVINLNQVNLNIKKLLPLLLSYKVYNEHKATREIGENKSLNIIVDEAHNILSYESLRESESWKDFRLETFEEIIKEGRKFGVFLTIASQRPSDISATIISQLHNYFIHRLVNNKDLEMIEKAVSYLDKLSVESLPILPVGACVLSGIIADLPVIVQVDMLDKESQPKSENISLLNSWFDSKDN